MKKSELTKLIKECHSEVLNEITSEGSARIDGLLNQKYFSKFTESLELIFEDLIDEGFDAVDIEQYLKDQLHLHLADNYRSEYNN